MQRSKLDIGRADAGAGGMSIRSGMGASSSSSDASAMAQSTGSSGAGSGSMCLEKSSSRRMECRGLCDGLAEFGVAACAQAMPSSCPSLGRASWREEAQYDVRELLLHGGHRALTGVDAGRVPEKDPCMFFFAQVQHVVQCGCELQDRGRGGPAVLGRDVASALLRQDGVCLGRLHDQHVQRAMVHAEGDRECRGLLCIALQLGLLHPAAAPPDLMHQEEAAGRLVDVHDAVCAGSVLVHEPAQLDEQPVRVGVLLLRAVELFQALGGLLVAQAHATQELLHPGEKATNLSHVGPHRSRSKVISASQ